MLDLQHRKTEAKIETKERYRWLSNNAMTLAEWALIPANPIQRDTERRAASAKHLAVFSPAHLRVAVAVLPTGEKFKIDGHTRAYMWLNRMTADMPEPLVLNADIYWCRDKEAVRDLYKMFDSRAAVETAQDDLFGVVSDAGLVFKSPMMRAYRFWSAVKRLYLMTNGYTSAEWSSPAFTRKVVNYFRAELVLLDSVSPKHNDFVTPIMITSLLTFMKDGDGALDFWQRYISNQGVKDERGCDGVQAMRNLLSRIRERKMHGNQHDPANIGCAVNAYQMFRGRNRYEGPSGVPHKKSKAELDAYIAAAVRAKQGRGK